ncbi:MAG: bifunctional riboflavin kinase/FAD synthetase [Deltaproteobacteria bacterium]|nr:bifunctional riboflavin kinase/FAD synthetase [Deltaproteobacteria bacterium]
MDVFTFRKFDQPGPRHAVLTIGNFDGVHRGHQALVARVLSESQRLNATAALMTFQPHPQSVLGQRRVPILTSIPHRVHLFESMGLDSAYFIPFTHELAAMSPEAFVQQFLLAYFQVKKLIIGFDFHFGKDRAGSPRMLEELSQRHGFLLEVFPEYALEGEKVSSSSIREAVQAFDFTRAARLLGRPYSLLAPVERGEQRGSRLGFPTLNMRCTEPFALPHGVYATRTLLNGAVYSGVTNHGLRPTVGTPAPLLETHLFDFSGDAYGKTAEVIPVARLREEMRFPTLDALRAQIAQDCQAARGVLAQAALAPA